MFLIFHRLTKTIINKWLTNYIEHLMKCITIIMFYNVTGDGAFSFQEFVEIVYNMGGTAEKTADQEEKELRDAFRVRLNMIYY